LTRLAPPVASLVLLLVLACRTPMQRPPAAGTADEGRSSFALHLVGHVCFPSASLLADLGNAVFGGLSGLAFDGLHLLAISDDPRAPRIFDLAVSLPPGAFGIVPKSVIRLRPPTEGPTHLDLEAISLGPGDDVWVSAEAATDIHPRVPPSVLQYTRGGGYVRRLPVPAKFTAEASGDPKKGVRNNEGFESLALAPDGGLLFTATETPLVQDGAPADFGRGARARILTFTLDGGEPRAGAEYVYPLDPLPRVTFEPGFRINGLVDLVALDRTRLLALERAFVQEGAGPVGRSFVRIYDVSLDGADDVSALFALGERREVRPASKHLVLDLAEVASQVPGLERLDNFEGMALLPPDASGERHLIVVSDDNFKPVQRTWFLLFRVATRHE
jgi:hypothetical protein